MNANTARKIDDAIDQAIRCGESLDDIARQVRDALKRALEARTAEQLRQIAG